VLTHSAGKRRRARARPPSDGHLEPATERAHPPATPTIDNANQARRNDDDGTTTTPADGRGKGPEAPHSYQQL